MARVDCRHCGSRGYFFFWSPGGQKWKMDCKFCEAQRRAQKRPPPKQKEKYTEEPL